jgi:hypothetical protein
MLQLIIGNNGSRQLQPIASNRSEWQRVPTSSCGAITSDREALQPVAL